MGTTAQRNRLIVPTRILVATDLTDLPGLLPHAIAQARGTGATLRLVHAMEPSHADLTGSATPAEEVAGEAQARRVLESYAREAERAGITCSTTVQHGVPSTVLLKEMQHAERLLIGTRRHGHTGSGMLGTVANALLREATVPVFAVSPAALSSASHTRPRRLLLPVSMSDDYCQTAGFALQLASSYGAELTLLHVLPSAALQGSYVRELFSQADAALRALCAAAPSIAVVHTVVEAGEPVLEILRVASEVQADWLLMSIEHDFHWWSMSTSTVYQVIAEAALPVLVVRRRMLGGDTGEFGEEAALADTDALH